MMNSNEYKFAPYSFSKINTYLNCPKRFHFQYVLKVKQGDCDRSALVRGSAIHEMFEQHQKGKEPKQTPYTADFKRALKRSEVKKIKEHLESTTKTCREISFGLTKDFEPCKYTSKDALFRGRIDLAYNDNGMLTIVDYKTGKAKDEKYQNFDQLLLYSIYFFQRYKTLMFCKVQFVYVDHDVVNSLVTERKYLENLKEHFLNTVKTIESATEYNPKQSRLCAYCPYKDRCL